MIGRSGARPLPGGGAVLLAASLAVAALMGGCDASAAGNVTVVSGPGPVSVTIAAKDIAWAPAALQLPADVDVTLVMDNQDGGVPHDLKVLRPGGATIAKTAVVLGPQRVELHLGPLTSGTYAFTCEVHPGMDGTIRVTK